MAVDIIATLRTKVRHLERILGWELDAQSECCGVTFAQRAVVVEVGPAGQVSLVDLAQRLGLDASTLSRTVNGLVNIGLVRREADARDRRYISISLTDQGRAVFQNLEDLSQESMKRVLRFIPRNKHKTVVQSFVLLTDALDKSRAEWACRRPEGQSTCAKEPGHEQK